MKIRRRKMETNKTRDNLEIKETENEKRCRKVKMTKDERKATKKKKQEKGK